MIDGFNFPDPKDNKDHYYLVCKIKGMNEIVGYVTHGLFIAKSREFAVVVESREIAKKLLIIANRSIYIDDDNFLDIHVVNGPNQF